MTIGLPITLSLQGSNVDDIAPTIEDLMLDCRPPIFTDGLEVHDADWVYEYNGIEFTPKIYNATSAEAGEYNLDEILVRDCKLVKVTGKKGNGITTHQRPFEPEEYGTYDTGLNYTLWTNRYMRIPASLKDGWLTKTWKSVTGKRWYYMFWENRGFGGCGDGGWRWSAKDLNANVGERNIKYYLRTCLRNSYSNKFNFAKDLKAIVPYWGSTECSGGCPKENTVQFKSMIERGGYFYFRTHLNAPIQYATYETGTAVRYSFMEVITPADIDGFARKRRTSANNPFDGKNYTRAEVDTTKTEYKATWTVLATEPLDSIAFGSVICDSIDIKAMDENGNTITELNNYRVENKVSDNSSIEHEATVVLYTGVVLPSETVISITLHGSQVSVGEIIGAETLEAGFTNTSFKNKFRDFSPKEQDKWGNVFYKDGVRVHVHSGTVEFETVDYDQLTRLMMLIGGRKVIINSSDSRQNEVPDGANVFQSTMMIARFTDFELESTTKNKGIAEISRYTFKIEETV